MEQSEFVQLLKHLRSTGFYNVQVEFALFRKCDNTWNRENILEKIQEVMSHEKFDKEYKAYTGKGVA